jgi:hypothetical protein
MLPSPFLKSVISSRLSSWLSIISYNHLCEREVGLLRMDLWGAQILELSLKQASVP